MTEEKFNFSSVLDDAKKMITNPVGFYREMPTEGGFVDPLIFMIVMAAIAGLISAVLSVVGLGVGVGMHGGAALAGIIVFPIVVTICGFIGAAILFVIWRLMGSDKNYEVAYRCIAYSMAIAPICALLSAIPYIGTIVRTLWGCYLLFIASTEVHQLKAQTAKIVFGILAAIGVLTGIGSENAARNVDSAMQELGNFEDLTAEQAGEKVGEFLKGLEKATKEETD